MSGRDAMRALAELARAYGVQPSYLDAWGRRVSTPAEGLLGAVRALGAPVERIGDAAHGLRERRGELERRVVEPVVVAWDGRLRGVDVRSPRAALVTVELEDGGRVDVETSMDGPGRLRVSSPERLPAGYHTLSVEARGSRSTAAVFAAPERAPAIPRGSWAVFAPLYALRSRDDGRIGTFTDLRELDGWAAGRGARMLGTLPLLSAFLDEPFEPSPYSPASRLFWNEVFVDVARVGEVDPAAAVTPIGPPAGDGSPWVDYRTVARSLRRSLEPLAERFFSDTPTERYRRFVHRVPEVRDYARFRAEVDRRRAWWGAWPARARDGRLRGAAESDPAGRYHLYAQWLAVEQLGEVGGRAKAEGRGLYLDLPLGVNGASYDVWRHRSAFAVDASAGAPPDLFFSGGQDWGFPPLHPERIREDGYAYPRAAVAHLLAYASALRIDHVMGLHRLYWVPRGVDPRHGAYVAYRPDEWYALLSIEAHRAGAAIVGEDLGTVPGYVRRTMRRHRFHTSYVIQFEAEPRSTSESADARSSSERERASGSADELTGVLRDPPPGCAASLGTHDLPAWAAFWRGNDLRELVELGLLEPTEAEARRVEREGVRRAIVLGLRERGLLDEGRDDVAAVLEAALRFLAGSDAALAVVALEDLWLEERPQNVPGTSTERPNWRGRMRMTLEQLATDERVNRLLEAVAAERVTAAEREEAA